MAKDWFYSRNGQRLGPVSETMLRSLIAGMEIGPSDLVWTDGQKEWKEAWEIQGLSTVPTSQVVHATASIPQQVTNPRDIAVDSSPQSSISRSQNSPRWKGFLVKAVGTLAILVVIVNGVRGYLSATRQPARGAKGVDLGKSGLGGPEIRPKDGDARSSPAKGGNGEVEKQQKQEPASPVEADDPKPTDNSKGSAESKAAEPMPEVEVKGDSLSESNVTDSQREIAEWVLGVGGNLLIQDTSGTEKTIRSVESLPFGSLTILKIDLTGIKEVRNGDLQKLKDAPQLIYLSVMTTSVSDEGLSHLQAIPSLEELNVAGTTVTGHGFRYLSGLRALRTLNCGGSPITDASLVNLSELSIVSLGLIDTQVTTEGAKHLKAMPTLKHLRLSGTGFTDQGLKQLSRLTMLETLMVDRTKVTEAGVRSFKADVPGCAVRYTSKAGVTLNERGVVKGSQEKGSEAPVTEPSFAGKYQVAIVNIENGRVQKSLQVEIKNDKSLLVSDGTKGVWSVRNKRLVVKAEALFGGLILTKQSDGSLVGEMTYAANKMRYRMTLTPVSP